MAPRGIENIWKSRYLDRDFTRNLNTGPDTCTLFYARTDVSDSCCGECCCWRSLGSPAENHMSFCFIEWLKLHLLLIPYLCFFWACIKSEGECACVADVVQLTDVRSNENGLNHMRTHGGGPSAAQEQVLCFRRQTTDKQATRASTLFRESTDNTRGATCRQADVSKV
jgi:hypothetical protein